MHSYALQESCNEMLVLSKCSCWLVNRQCKTPGLCEAFTHAVFTFTTYNLSKGLPDTVSSDASCGTCKQAYACATVC